MKKILFLLFIFFSINIVDCFALDEFGVYDNEIVQDSYSSSLDPVDYSDYAVYDDVTLGGGTYHPEVVAIVCIFLVIVVAGIIIVIVRNKKTKLHDSIIVYDE